MCLVDEQKKYWVYAKRLSTVCPLMYDRVYYEAHREHINQQHRDNYAKHRERRNATRQAQYQEQRCDILLKQKHDRAPCPLCNLTFRRVYIPRHMARRHPVQ